MTIPCLSWICQHYIIGFPKAEWNTWWSMDLIDYIIHTNINFSQTSIQAKAIISSQNLKKKIRRNNSQKLTSSKTGKEWTMLREPWELMFGWVLWSYGIYGTDLSSCLPWLRVLKREGGDGGINCPWDI